MTAKYVEGDHGTVIRRHVKDEKGVKIDITGALAVKLRWIQNSVMQEREMEITDAANGVCEYIIESGDLLATDAAGVSFELEYNDAAGNRYTTPSLDGPYEIRKAVGATVTRRK